MKKLNLNSIIKIRLNDYGKDIYYCKNDELNKRIIARGGEPLERRYPEVDKDGFSSFQLWDFMAIYGPFSGLGYPEFWQDLNIYIEDEDLDDVPESNPSLGNLT